MSYLYNFQGKWQTYINNIIIYLNFEESIKTDIFCILKCLESLSPIYFVKIQLPDIFYAINEFLIKMYRLLQNYTFEICTLSKIMNICCKYNIFLLVCLYLQAIERYTRDWFATVVLTQFSFSSLIYIDIKMFLKVYQQTL